MYSRRALLVGILAVIVLAPARAQQAGMSVLEQRMQAYYQNLYSKNINAIFVLCHPIGNSSGKPNAVTVTAVKITQWKNGEATEEFGDVVQFTVDYMVLWRSKLHPLGGGHTEARSTYVVSNKEVTPVSNIIVSTNALRLTSGQTVGILKIGGKALGLPF
jgi:hypothetical protein